MIWCLAPSPNDRSFDEALGRDKPPKGYAYLLNPDEMIYRILCQLPSGHDGPHDWETP